MKKLNGEIKIKTAVFISGRGSNLKNLLKFSKKKISPISIDLIISDNKYATGLKFSEKFNINKKIFNFNNTKIDSLLLEFIRKKDIKFICLAGFMRILSKKFLKNFNGKIINIHPSLLPKYKGLNTHKKVIQNKDEFSGCSVHYVNAKLDSGKIILKKKVKVYKKDTIRSLSNRVLKAEHKLYPLAILKIFN